MPVTTTSTPTPVVDRPANRFPRTHSFSVDLFHPSAEGFSPGHEYVRRFWAAAIGRGAIRDLLDLFVAGLRQKAVQEPFYLRVLLSAGLVDVRGDRIWIPSLVPMLPSVLVSRLSPYLRSEHRRWEQ